MANEDFDIDSLADYLHLEAGKVTRLAERGQIPGRRLGGVWKFSPAEIHHWLETRIGISDEDELARVEGALDRAAPATAPPSVSLANMLPLEAIAIPLEARTKNSVIASMVDLAAQTGLLWDTAKMVEAVRSREELHPTAMENGVALLHPRRPQPSILGEAFLALGRTNSGLPFGNTRGSMTDIFFLILSTDDRVHLWTLARLSRLIGNNDFLEALRAAPSAAAAHALIAERETQLS
jgi:PTS system nitrogen regulatory IIA component